MESHFCLPSVAFISSKQRQKYMYIYSDYHYLQSTFYTNIKTQNIISDSDSWESVDAKVGLTDTRDTE